MTSRAMRHAIDWARNAVLEQEVTALSDAQFLEAFVASRSETAFTAILRRHGPMVFAVCKRFLLDHHDAEDAFQAVFLVLAKRADTIRPASQLANWLYGVAFKTASKMRLLLGKRRARERNNVSLPERSNIERQVWSDFWLLFDQELNRLPDKYRAAIVLCDLEGRSRRDAALALGILDGALSSRLSRGRKQLAARLSRRGVTLSGAALAAAIIVQDSTAALPATLVAKTVRLAFTLAGQGMAATGGSAAAIVTATQGVIRSMFIAKLWQASAVVVVSLLAIGAGASVMTMRGHGAGPVQEVVTDDTPKGKEATGQTGKESSDTQEGGYRVQHADDRIKKLNAARQLWIREDFEERWKRSLAGTLTLDFLLHASTEFRDSELASAENIKERLAAHRSHIGRVRKLCEIGKARLDAGKVANQDLDKTYEAFEQAIRMLHSEESKAYGENPEFKRDTRRVSSLRKDLLDAANQEWDARWKEFLGGRGSQTDLLASSGRLRDAQLKNRKNLEDERSAYRTHIERLFRIEKIARDRFDAGKLSTIDLQESRYARIEAELEYEQAVHRQ